MKTNMLKYALMVTITSSLCACIVAPPQPIGYRQTSAVLPTYVNGQYIGMQPSNYAPPANGAATQQPSAPVPPAPVYLQSTTPSVVYVQAPQPVYDAYPPAYYPYGAYPYYSPYFANPWFGGIGIGVGFRVRVH